MGRKRAPPRWEGGSVPTAKRSSTRLCRQGAAGPSMAAVTSCAALLARRPGNDSVHTDPSVQERGARAGQVVWARLGSARWWPAVRISGPECGQSPARLGHAWVFWLGDHKVSQVPETKVVDFSDEYRERRSSLGGKLYEVGLLEALQEIAARSPGLPQGADSSHLIAWAEAGFLNGSGVPQIAPAVSGLRVRDPHKP
ncbi:DNA (cytosine-5)-methyltransferase 3A [Ixodes scapularis]|uniref:DNA (cytosine-5)-methyltransferase 3A n=1 Tax=Ixodes scapularis TaxID=6945 RepID=UPI001A9D5579|nr:DNA (cytosine-5)-methyltransferase 3A [Ixodes scapularis]